MNCFYKPCEGTGLSTLGAGGLFGKWVSTFGTWVVSIGSSVDCASGDVTSLSGMLFELIVKDANNSVPGLKSLTISHQIFPSVKQFTRN